MNSQQPQSCTKCGCLPEDILMLACSHDLCLNCASDRLGFQMKKNKNANVIVCQQCFEKTPLDAQSVDVLKSMMNPSSSAGRSYVDNNKYNDLKTQSKFDKAARNDTTDRNTKFNYNKTSSLGIDRGIDKGPVDRTGNKLAASKLSNTEMFNNIPSKKNCVEHSEEEILYFCFDCKCECICPECVIHGKHKDHDVKTVRKSQPIVKTQIDNYIDKYQGNVEGLLIRKSQIEKQIRYLNESNNVSKKQIQQAFEDLRGKINAQQKQLLTRCDQNLDENLSQLQKASSLVLRKIDQLKSFSITMNEATRKDEILFLNFYSRKWRQIQQESKQPEIYIPSAHLQSNETVLSQILDTSDQVARIGTSQRQKIYNHN